ncbi:MAG TPA: OB-fold domain-containing protein, partial [Oscillospiraceae bacterium]|nr:OB-fold domain-containing protein [Oscillospiraceae bacterium]
MIYSVSGEILAIGSNYVAIECNGLGFSCLCTRNTLDNLGAVGSKATLYTYLNVREDAMELYGFYEAAALEVFKLLITVSGVGPKVSLA